MAVPDQGRVIYAADWLTELPPPGELGVLRLRFRAIAPSSGEGTPITVEASRMGQGVVATTNQGGQVHGLPWDVRDPTLVVSPR
jgi:hypothetical protein